MYSTEHRRWQFLVLNKRLNLIKAKLVIVRALSNCKSWDCVLPVRTPLSFERGTVAE